MDRHTDLSGRPGPFNRVTSNEREAKRAELLRKKKWKDRRDMAIGLTIILPVLLLAAAFVLGGLLWATIWLWTNLPI